MVSQHMLLLSFDVRIYIVTTVIYITITLLVIQYKL